MTIQRGSAIGLAAAALLLSGACSFNFSIGEKSIDKEKLASKVSETLVEITGESPDALTCPADLPAEVGATVRCELITDGQTYGVTVTTTTVEGDDVNFDFKVDDHPTG